VSRCPPYLFTCGAEQAAGKGGADVFQDLSQKFDEEMSDGKAGPSTPFPFAKLRVLSLRMTVHFVNGLQTQETRECLVNLSAARQAVEMSSAGAKEVAEKIG